jgi:RNA recognition motif-containing protein
MGTRVYVGGLPRDATTREVQDGFSRYGHVANIWIARNPPGFAFVVSAPPRSRPSFRAAPALARPAA